MDGMIDKDIELLKNSLNSSSSCSLGESVGCSGLKNVFTRIGNCNICRQSMPAMYPFDNLVAIVCQFPLAYCKPCGYLYPVRLLDDSDLDWIPEGLRPPPNRAITRFREKRC